MSHPIPRPPIFTKTSLILVSVLVVCISGYSSEAPRYRVGVCDWMILKRQKLGAFQLAKELGANGVEVDMGGLGNRPTFDNQLVKPEVRDQFLAKAKELNLGIPSIALSGFYAQSFATRDGVDRMVQDAIDTAKAMGVTVLFLPLGVQGDLVQHPELRPAIVERLKLAGRQAAMAGMVLGVETALDAKGDAALLDEVGSPSLKIYFNLANALQNGRDPCAELKILGKDRIVQIHASNKDGFWLEKDPQVDLAKIKATLDEMGWSGWLVIERSRDGARPTDVKYNFTANAAYLKKVFQAK
ncbi:MAG TPA: sugar phosphate isomerase/epimerase family protein [Lacunisphaera sp.]|nr:sugar phosphate isomerase/epimerase family protein [Lacunisphaera sp.]